MRNVRGILVLSFLITLLLSCEEDTSLKTDKNFTVSYFYKGEEYTQSFIHKKNELIRVTQKNTARINKILNIPTLSIYINSHDPNKIFLFDYDKERREYVSKFFITLKDNSLKRQSAQVDSDILFYDLVNIGGRRLWIKPGLTGDIAETGAKYPSPFDTNPSSCNVCKGVPSIGRERYNPGWNDIISSVRVNNLDDSNTLSVGLYENSNYSGKSIWLYTAPGTTMNWYDLSIFGFTNNISSFVWTWHNLF